MNLNPITPHRHVFLVLILFLLPSPAAADTAELFKRIPTQYIAALGEPDAAAGTGAEHWGLWTKDPGPRGVWFRRYDDLKSSGGIAPAKWRFDEKDWWLDENGLIMEKPVFSLSPGKYLVTGDRETTSVLTVHPMDVRGSMRWELGYGAKLYDVTHLPCRSARYRPQSDTAVCAPDRAKREDFPVSPGHSMPVVSGCRKKEYAVLFVIAKAAEAELPAAGKTACTKRGKRYPGLRILDHVNGTMAVCPDPDQVVEETGPPYRVRRADLRRLEDPSQRPRCGAKQQIEAICGSKRVCTFRVNNTLCTEPEIAKYTTHAQIEWKCSTDNNWRYERVERGRELVFDCRR